MERYLCKVSAVDLFVNLLQQLEKVQSDDCNIVICLGKAS